MISLFGMILVVGILVDDGIVIAENIYTHFERGKPAHKAAIDGTMEVLTSVLSSVMTTIVAFSILLFVEGLEMMREMAFVVIACLAFSLFEAFIILPGHLGHKRVLSEEKNMPFSLLKGGLFMLAGLVMIFLGSRLYPENAGSPATLLFPFGLMIIGAIVIFKGFSKSPIEHNVRAAADRFIKYIRDNWYNTAVRLIVGTKRKWYRLGFVFPLVFTVLIISLLGSGVISATFFPNIQPDFFTVEAAYNPGDSKEKTKEFIDRATKILLEENQQIIEETGDTMVTYFSSNIGFTQSLGQIGDRKSVV